MRKTNKKIKEKEKCKYLIQKYRLVLQEDVEDINQERPKVAATKKTSTGIINIMKTSFYKKRKEKSQSRTLNITHHALVNPTSH